MMNARREHRLWQRLLIGQHPEQDLQHRADNPRPARPADDEADTSVAGHNRRRHAAERGFARRHRVGIGLAQQPKGVRLVRLGVKIVHLIVEHNPGSGHHHAAAKEQVDGLGGGHGVAGRVDGRQVGRAGRFNLPRRVGNAPAGAGLGQINAVPQCPAIGVRDQHLDRYLNKITIAQVACPISKGQAQGLGQHMGGGRGMKAELLDRKTRQHLQHLDDQHPARTGQGHGVDPGVLKAPGHGRSGDNLIAVQVGLGDQSAPGLHFGYQRPGNRTAIKGVFSGGRDRPQAGGQIFLNQQLPFAQEAILPKIDRPGGRRVAQHLLTVAQGPGQKRINRKAVLGEVNRRSHHVGQRQAAVLFVHVNQAGHQPGHADGQRAGPAQRRHGFALPHKHVAGGSKRRPFSKVKGQDFLVFSRKRDLFLR